MKKSTKIFIALLIIGASAIAGVGICRIIYIKNQNLSMNSVAIGEKFINENRLSEAIKELEKALKLDPRNTHAEKVLLDVYLNAGQYQDAIKMQLSQLRLASDKIWDFKRKKRLGEIYVKIGDIENAKEIYKFLADKYTKTSGGYLGLTVCYENEGNLSEAIECQKRAIDILENYYGVTPKAVLKKELQKLLDLYSKTGQAELRDEISRKIENIKE